jgi:hypothetical protein
MAGAAAKPSIITVSAAPVRIILFIVDFIIFDPLSDLCGRPCGL